MERYSRYALICARILMSIVFLLNGFGVMNQAIPAKEMIERGIPPPVVRLRCLQGDFWRSSQDSGSRSEFSPVGVLRRCLLSWFLQHSSRTRSGLRQVRPSFKSNSSTFPRMQRSGAA